MLEVRHISFAYANRTILDDVSFSVEPGAGVALVGPNGVGKSTLLKVLSGLYLPSSGSVLVDDVDTLRQSLRYRRMLGYLPEGAPVDLGVTVKAYLRFRARLKGEQSKKIRYRVSEALELCGLESVADRITDTLSLGLRKRLALADVLLLRPRVLLLDDLFAGIDEETRVALLAALPSITTFSSVIIAGHAFDDMAACTKRFLMLKDGHVQEVADVKTVREKLK